MRKFLLSTGKTTDKIEYYVVDLFRLYLSVYPGDIPGASRIGFDFNLRDTFKPNLATEVQTRITSLVSTLSSRFTGLTIELVSCELIDETLVRVIVSCGEVQSEEIIVNIYNEY